MSYITRTGNLTGIPELRDGKNGKYCYARVAVSDRIKDGDDWVDGPTIYYNVAVSGDQAVRLHEAAKNSGNIRVLFSGKYTVTEYRANEGGEARINHEVKADEVGVSLRGQAVTVARGH